MKKLLKIITGATLSLAMAIGVGVGVASNNKKPEPVYADNFNTTYNYSGQGTTWTGTNFSNESSYWKSSSENDCVASVSGIFTNKTITSNVVVTLDVACYGNGSNPTSSKFSIYADSSCQTQVAATQGGTLPSSSTYTSPTYTVTLANAASFSSDLAIKIASGTKLIRFRSFTIAFSYTESGGGVTTYTLTYDKNTTDTVTGMPSPQEELVADTYDLSNVVPERTGYTFGGWAATSESTTPISSITITNSNKTVYAIWTENIVSGTFNKWTSPLVPGDYIFTYGSVAMGNVVSNSKIQNSSLTFTSGVDSISNPKVSAVWTLDSFEENSTTYWSIYNSTVEKYIKWNSSTNVSLVDTVENNAKWTLVADNATKDFQVNGDTRRLRAYNNVWGTYASSNGGTLTLYKKHVSPTGLSLDETELTISSGEITTLTATIAPNGATATVLWTTSNSSVATVDDGVVTAKGAGSATITAFIDSDSSGGFNQGDINATCSVTVTDGVPATDIELDETSVELLAGQQITLSATPTPNNSTDTIVWSSSNETIAIVNNGVVTTLKNGIVTITATAGSVHADCELSITSATAAENFVNAKIDRTGKLVAVSGKNAIIDDGYGGFWAYSNTNFTQTVGAIVNLKGTSTIYSGGLEVAGATLTTTQHSISESEATPLSESAAKDYLDSYLAEPADPDFFMPTKKVSLRTGVIGGEGNFLTWEYGETLMETNLSTGNMQAGKKYDIEGYIFKFYTSNEDQTYIVVAVTQASEVEIHATSVSLNNDSLTIVEGDSETLTATLSPAGSVESVKWASSDEDVATVAAGVVTGIAPGSATITAYVDEDDDDVVDLGELKAECEVTVNPTPIFVHTKVASYDFTPNEESSTTEYSKADLLARFNASSKASGGLSNIVTNVTASSKVYKGQASYCHFGLKFGTGSANGTFTVSLNTQVKRIVVKAVGWSVSDTLTVGDAEAQIPGIAYTEENPIKTLIFDITESNSVTFTYATRGYILSIDFYTGVETDDPQDFVDTASLVQTIHGHENYTDAVLTSVDSVAIRFGARISKYNWQDMKTKWGITDYGVMLMKEDDLILSDYSTIEDNYNHGASSSILKIINKCAGGAAYADPYLDGDDYLFTIKVSFINGSEDYDDVIYAAPYVVVGGQYCFITETCTSVQDLALDYYNTGYEYLSDAGLTYLVNA